MIQFVPGLEAVQAALADWTAADPLPYSLISAIAGSNQAWRGVIERDGQAIAVLARTPGWPAVLASSDPPDDDAVAVVAGLVRDHGGINAPVAWAEAVAKAVSGRAAGCMGLRLHRLAGPPRLPRPVPGRAVSGVAVDQEIIRAWCGEFSRAIEPDQPWRAPTDAELHPTLPQYRIWLDESQPVSMALAQRPFHGGWSISRVYTPPQHRRRGYAGAVVHALCQAKLAEGATYLALFTDIANPTSNRLYAEIGFVPVCDQVRITWSLP